MGGRFALLNQLPRVRFLVFLKIFLAEISLDVAKINRQHALLSIKWTVQSLITLIGPI